jgi:hypothetical protein
VIGQLDICRAAVSRGSSFVAFSKSTAFQRHFD